MIRTGKIQVRAQPGFTLIELVVTILIVGILASIAYPAYTKSVAKTKRRTAEACLSNFATHMERFYTTNLSYSQDTSGNAVTLPQLDCASAQNSGADYTFSIPAKASSSYTLKAQAGTIQTKRDSQCATLTIDQTGARLPASCW